MMLRLSIILIIASCALATKLKLVYEWKYIDYDWECKEQKYEAISEKRYNATQIFTIDIQKVPDGRVFVTTPAARVESVPASLSTVSKKRGPGGPLLTPYPNWHWYNSKHCKGITSVWRIAVDECQRLWVLDSGKIATEQVCLAQLLVFDLKTDKLLRRIKIPNDISHNPRNKTQGRLTYPIVQTEGVNCEKTWVYMVDFEGGGFAFFNGSSLWRRDDNVLHPEQIVTQHSVGNEAFSTTNGILGLALSPKTSSNPDRLFFRPTASKRQYSVSVADLQKPPTSNKKLCYKKSKYCTSNGVPSQIISRDGILFFGLLKEVGLACWNINTPMDKNHVVTVAQNYKTLQYPSGLKIVQCADDPSKEELWISTNRLQRSITNTRNLHEINFRIFKASIDSLVNGTTCQVQPTKDP